MVVVNFLATLTLHAKCVVMILFLIIFSLFFSEGSGSGDYSDEYSSTFSDDEDYSDLVDYEGSGAYGPDVEAGSGDESDCDDEDGHCGPKPEWPSPGWKPWDTTTSTSTTTTTTTTEKPEDIVIDDKDMEIDSGSDRVATVKAIISLLLPTAVCWLGHWMTESTVHF